jgi:hypothetical protein
VVSQAEILEIEKEGKKAFLSVMVYEATNLFCYILSLNTKILKGCSENCRNKFEEKIPGRACCAS